MTGSPPFLTPCLYTLTGLYRLKPPTHLLAFPIRQCALKPSYVAAGLAVYAITAYMVYDINVTKKTPENKELPSQDADVSSIYDSTARSFDNCVTWSEFLGGVNGQRRYLVRQAKGHVLEVSVGTGRNAKYYNLDYTWGDWFRNMRWVESQRKRAVQLAKRELEADLASSGSTSGKEENLQVGPDIGIDVSTVSPWVESRSNDTEPTIGELKKRSTQVRTLTFVDLSGPMIEIARKKFERRYPGYSPVQFLTQSALQPLPLGRITTLAYQQGGFDFVLQSMGLCSTPDPVRLLRQLGKVAHPDRGRILLLEHGKGHWEWMNKYLDSTASRHAKKHGCWYNRDIGKLVEESGLVIERCKRKHFGTLWIIEARPRRETDEAPKAAIDTARPTPSDTTQGSEENNKHSETLPRNPGWTTRVWGSVKTLTGINSLKEEDSGRNNTDSQKKDD